MVIPLLIALAASIQAPAKADALTFGAPQKVVSLDKIKGEPIELAWSPDGTQLYVEAGQRTNAGTFLEMKHYVITLADKDVKGVDAPPQWATDYQTWKANKWAPGLHSFVIAISEGTRTDRAVSAPMGGALAKGGESGASTGNMDDAVGHSIAKQTPYVITLKLKGETVGEMRGHTSFFRLHAGRPSRSAWRRLCGTGRPSRRHGSGGGSEVQNAKRTRSAGVGGRRRSAFVQLKEKFDANGR